MDRPWKDEKYEEKRVQETNVRRSSIQKRSTKDENDSIPVETIRIDERKLLWKIDLHIVPWLSLLYLLSFLDRGNIGNAKVGTYFSNIKRLNSLCRFWQLYNLEKDLGITDRQYLNGLTVFFFPYAFIQVSSLCVLAVLSHPFLWHSQLAMFFCDGSGRLSICRVWYSFWE